MSYLHWLIMWLGGKAILRGAKEIVLTTVEEKVVIAYFFADDSCFIEEETK